MERGLRFGLPASRPGLQGASVFLSASIPNPRRWDGEYDPLEITDAVVAFARASMSAGLRIVTAAHPTIAPLLLYVGAELPRQLDARVVVYQSRFFEAEMPSATRRFEDEGISTIRWTDAVFDAASDLPDRERSLELMRRRMLEEAEPDAAVFIGGMEGVQDEFELFRGLREGAPVYPLAHPGGAAGMLARSLAPSIPQELLEGSVYPTVWRQVLDDLEARR